MTVKEFFIQHPKAAVAFSGGCDSAYLLYEAMTYGADIGAYYMNTPFQPAFELEDARRFCRQYNIPLTVLSEDVCRIPSIVENSVQRCYYCKQAIFSRIQNAAAGDGYELLLDGTNASDDARDRPGMKALAELHVLSPLRLCHLSKDQIRSRSKELGLFTHDKPAYACLATRIPAGVTITPEDLRRVEDSETCLFALGFSNFRVRLYHDAAQIELPADQFLPACRQREEILHRLSPYFSHIFLDLRTR